MRPYSFLNLLFVICIAGPFTVAKAQLNDPDLIFFQRNADYWSDIDDDGDIDFYDRNTGIWTERNDEGLYLKQHVFNLNVLDLYHDIDEDGDLDAIGKQLNNDVYWFENIGDDGIWSDHLLGNWTGWNDFFDLNLDGHDDLITASEDGNFFVRFSLGNGQYQAVEEFALTNPFSFFRNGYFSTDGYLGSAYGDLDQDGFDDVVSTYCSEFGCLNGRYSVFRFSSQAFAEIIAPQYVNYTVNAILDINEDGLNELLVYDFSTAQMEVMYNPFLSDYVTTTPILGLEDMGSELRMADFNGDDITDVLTYTSFEAISGIRLGNGDGTFQTQLNLPENLLVSFPYSLSIVDIDLDGDLDIGEGVRYFLNEGNGEFAIPVQFEDYFGLYQIFNNVGVDPQIEYLSVGNSVVHFDENGDVSAIDPNNIASVYAPYSFIHFQDLNDDHCDDMIMFEDLHVRIFVCTENGLEEESSIDLTAYLSGPYSGFAHINDFFDMNMDGNKDFLIVESGFPDGLLQLSIHPDLSTTIISDYPFSSPITNTPYYADIDMDGDMDVSLWEDPSNYYENQGDGTLIQLPFAYPEQSFLFNMGSIDINGDGILDTFDGYAFLEFDGYGGIEEHVFSYPIDFTEHTFLFSDFNADNLPDLFVYLFMPLNSTTDFEYKIYINQGNFDFFETQSVTLPGMMLNGVQMGDVNGDGYNDIIGLADAANITRGWYWLENIWDDYNVIAGHIFVDENTNGLWDAGETGIDQSNVLLNPEGSIQFASSHYLFPVEPGNYQVQINYDENVWTPTTPVEYDVAVNAETLNVLHQDFGFVPTDPLGAVLPQLNAGFAVCGGMQQYNVQVLCVSESIGPLSVTVSLDPALMFMYGSIPFTSENGNNYTWLFPAQPYGSTLTFQIFVQYPDVSTIGSTITSEVNACILNDSYEEVVCGNFIWNEVQACSYDPNMKEVSPAGNGTAGLIFNGTELTYTIHFQNTGTAPAQTVVVEDQLSEYLDPSTMQILSWSHAVETTVENGLIRFEFEEIMLPDSLSDPVGSQGYVTYRISPFDELVAGTNIENTANIYFDLNEAIVTNTTVNTIFECDGIVEGGSLVSDCDVESMIIDPQISDALEYHWLVNGETYSVEPVLNLALNAGSSYDVILEFTTEFCASSIQYNVTAPVIPDVTIEYGPSWGYIQTFSSDEASIEWYYNGELMNGENEDTLYIGYELGGDFTVVVTASDGCSNSFTGNFVYDHVLESSITNLLIFPSPASDVMNFKSDVMLREMKLTDLSGQLVNLYSLRSSSGSVDLTQLAPGIYQIEFITENGHKEIRSIVKL